MTQTTPVPWPDRLRRYRYASQELLTAFDAVITEPNWWNHLTPEDWEWLRLNVYNFGHATPVITLGFFAEILEQQVTWPEHQHALLANLPEMWALLERLEQVLEATAALQSRGQP